MVRSVVSQLPADVREWFEAELVRRNFSDYSSLTDELNERLERAGFEIVVSRSSAHRYGQELERTTANLKRATLEARTIAKEVGDDEGALTDALARLLQEKLFRVFCSMGDLDPEQINITKIGHMIADLGRMSIMQKKHQIVVRERAKVVAEDVAKRAQKGGLSADAVEQIKRDILGIANE